METPDNNLPGNRQPEPLSLVDLVIRLALAALLMWLAAHAFAPFLVMMVWAVVLAVSLHPLNQKLAARLGGSNGRAATVLVLLMLILLGVPTVLLGMAFIDHVIGFHDSLSEGRQVIPPPPKAVEDWPLIGQQIYAAWQSASTNFTRFAEHYHDQLLALSRDAVAKLGSTLTALLAFTAAFIVAGILLAYTTPSHSTARRIFSRVCGPEHGPQMLELSVATVRSVSSGVIGVAFIQALLLGIGFLLCGVPGAGLLAVVALILGIAQIPAILVVIPVLVWLWSQSDASTLGSVVFSVYLVLAGLADNVLKPMLLGRGVAVPMPVILLGALGGMISAGLTGLFVGAVILALGYEVLKVWVRGGEPEPPSTPEHE
ncbi:AI-2E family transporter [Microbulbifer agarilyticus]|uniref:AI-2E family transporter n=1 Tax=Microbulbifer agarilyticus TaxID=260552 RepID=UPI001C95512E|nr:AI-2E family transporter [Microbulbifer agarilyticus]MBY6191084.1 AI-2E family transporter [Microbulbifer agarilyticus]